LSEGRSEDITAFETELQERRTQIISCIKVLQELCPHDKVVESPWRSSDYGTAFPARRICIQCGLEEVIYNYSWPSTTIDGGLYEFQRTPGQRTILDSEFVKKDDVCKYRIKL
jgi:hypothetical protein